MSERPSRRGRAAALLAALLLLAGIVRIGLVVLHVPLAGYANQYDMARTSACLGLWPDVAPEQRALATPEAPLSTYRHGSAAAAACYPSTTVALLAAAIAVDRIGEAIGSDKAREFDLHQFALLQALLLVSIALAMHRRLRRHPSWRSGHAAFFALVLADPFNTLHLATLYTEAAALIALYATLALLLHLALADGETADAQTSSRSVHPAILALLVACLLALGFSRVQHLLLPLALVPVLAFALWSRGRSGRIGVAVLLVAALLVLLLQGVQQRRSGGIDAANRSNAVLGALLPAATDAEAMTARLGLPPRCASLEHVTWYLRRGRDVAAECPQLASVPLSRIAIALIADPLAMPVLAGRGLAQATAWRLPYLGELAGGNYARLRQPSLADALATRSFALHAWLWLLPPLWLALQSMRWRRRGIAAADLLLTAAVAVIGLGWVSALLGDGYSELTRHLHLAQNALLLAWALLLAHAVTLLQRLRGGVRAVAAQAWPLGTAALLAALVAVTLPRLPLAEGVLEARAAGGGQLDLEGWALDPSGVHAVVVRSAGRAHAMELLPAPLVAPLFPLPGGAMPAVVRFSGRVPTPARGERLHLLVTGAHGQSSEADAVQPEPALRSANTR